MRKKANVDDSYQYSIEYINFNADMKLACHAWIPGAIKHIIFYIHGMQSHAGWLFETGPYFAKAGIAIFALDRRGSGLSDGVRGDIENEHVILQDYLFSLRQIKYRYPNIALTLIGQSLGGSILLALVSMPIFDINFQNIMFVASPLGKRHSSLSQLELNSTLSKTSLNYISTAFNERDFSDVDRYIQFMNNDPLCCKKMTERSMISLIKLEKIYLESSGVIANKQAIYLCPEIDPIIDLNSAIAVFKALSKNNGKVKSFATKKHYLWFTEKAPAVHRWVKSFLLEPDKTKI